MFITTVISARHLPYPEPLFSFLYSPVTLSLLGPNILLLLISWLLL